jgi:hypothetical protein
VTATALDGIAMIDLSGKANLKVGSWVAYHTVSDSYLGYHEDYKVLLLIAAEEEFWGERCFWLETWTMERGDTVCTASLVSNAALGDTASARNPAWFERKSVRSIGDDGLPEELIPTRPSNQFRVPQASRGHRPDEAEGIKERSLDTLAVDTCRTPIGSFRGPGVREITTLVQEVMRGDSTVHYTRDEERIRRLDSRIPITRLARETIHDVQKNRIWLTGQSGQSTTRVLEEARGLTMITGYGDHGVAPRVVSLIRPHVSARRLRWVTATGAVASATTGPPPGSKTTQGR